MLGNQRWLCSSEHDGSLSCFSPSSESLIFFFPFFFSVYYYFFAPHSLRYLRPDELQRTKDWPWIDKHAVEIQSNTSEKQTNEQTNKTTSFVHAGFSARPPASFSKVKKGDVCSSEVGYRFWEIASCSLLELGMLYFRI